MEQIKKLNYESFKPKFHESWHFGLQEIIESKEMWDIFQFIKGLSAKGIKLTPLSSDLFKSFEIDYNTLRVVLQLMDVYPKLNKQGIPQSNGIALDCSQYGGISPSLQKFYEGIEKDVYNGLNLYYDKENLSLQYLIDQGVMVTNLGLLTEVGKPGKHLELFKPFWKMIYDKFFAHRSLIFIYCGKDAQKLEAYTQPFLHTVFKIEHPVAASYSSRDWETNKTFTKVNKLLEDSNGRGSEIKWLYEPYNDLPWA